MEDPPSGGSGIDGGEGIEATLPRRPLEMITPVEEGVPNTDGLRMMRPGLEIRSINWPVAFLSARDPGFLRIVVTRRSGIPVVLPSVCRRRVVPSSSLVPSSRFGFRRAGSGLGRGAGDGTGSRGMRRVGRTVGRVRGVGINTPLPEELAVEDRGNTVRPEVPEERGGKVVVEPPAEVPGLARLVVGRTVVGRTVVGRDTGAGLA